MNLIKQRNQQDNRNSTNELANKLAVKERERERLASTNLYGQQDFEGNYASR